VLYMCEPFSLAETSLGDDPLWLRHRPLSLTDSLPHTQAMPASVLGGMTTFLFGSVAVAGIRILAMVKWSRRTRFIATASLSPGFASVVQPEWFS
jgi:hypothetical protein